jgi:hypothetical protein
MKFWVLWECIGKKINTHLRRNIIMDIDDVIDNFDKINEIIKNKKRIQHEKKRSTVK